MPSLNSAILSSCCHRAPRDYRQLDSDSPKLIKPEAPDKEGKKKKTLTPTWSFLRRLCSIPRIKDDGFSEEKELDKNIKLILDKADKLLNKLDEHEPELAGSQDEECVICVGAKATMQTFPCGHRVVCRKCFVKTIQMAVSQRMLPLRCVICRTKIIRLKQTTGGFATPATHTPHLANTRACLLRQPGMIDAEGFSRSPFLTPEEFEKAPSIKQYTRQDCRFHKHWKNKVAAAPLPQDVNDILIVPGTDKVRTSPAKDDRRKRLSLKVGENPPHLPTPPRKKDVKRAPVSPNQPLSPTIIVENFRNPLKNNSVSQQQQQQPLKDKRSAKLEGVAKDRRKINAIADKELEMIPLVRLMKPPSPIKRRGSKTSTGSTASTPEICITPPEDDDDDDDDDDAAAEEETHLIITTQPIKKLEFHTERFSLPTIPPPKLTLIDPRKGDRQLSILDNAIDEEDELLLSVENSTTLPEETETVTVVVPTPEIRIAPPPNFRRRSHRVAPEPRLQKPTTRFEKFKQYHVRQPLPLFPIPEKEEMQENIELRDAQAFYKVDDKLAASQSIPLISADNMVTVGGSFLNSATRTKMALLSSFKQLRSKSPLKAFGIRSRKTVAPLLDIAEATFNM